MSKLAKVIVSLALVVAFVGAGIWALLFNEEFSFGGRVSFEVKNASVRVDAKVELNEAMVGDPYTYDSEKSNQHTELWEIEEIDLSSASDVIRYTFSVANTGTGDVVVVIQHLAASTGFALEYKPVGEEEEIENTIMVTIGAGDSFEFVYELSFIGRKRGSYENETQFYVEIEGAV